MSVVTVLLLLSYSAWLVPDGIIDLTKIANNDGTPMYIALKRVSGS